MANPLDVEGIGVVQYHMRLEVHHVVGDEEGITTVDEIMRVTQHG